MPSLQFQPILRDVRDILGADYYEIPRFQRPYSWNLENLEDFWRDVIHDNDEGYFIGPMVAFTARKGNFGIVDGQQRLTTISLILAAVRDLMSELADKSLATGIARYLERPDDDNLIHYVLRSIASEKYLTSQILASPPRSPKTAITAEERNLSKAFSEIRKRLDEEVRGLSDEPLDDGSPVSPRGQKLREIRDRILTLQVIWIRLDNQDDAYIVFETLNSRGKDLEVVDLLKNHLLNYVRQENADLDNARSEWDEMRQILEEKGGHVNPNKFILHWWLSQRDYAAEKKLFRLIKSSTSKPEGPLLISDLKSNASLYARIANPSGWDIPKGAAGVEVRDSLAALATFGVSQPRPMLLSLLRAYDEKEISYAVLRKTLLLIENFHFVTTAVVGVSSTGGVSVMYAKHGRELSKATSASERQTTLAALRAKLSNTSRLPARETFLSEFPRVLRYSEHETGQKKLVQYALRKLHDGTRPSAALDHSKCSIEHLSSQSEAEDWMPSIGNLFWIESRLNTKLGNKSFLEKKKVLERHSQVYDFDDILALDHWGEAEAEERGARLARLAWEEIWKL